MAAVPEYNRQVSDRPAHQQKVNVRTSADSFGAGIGRAAQTLGDGIFRAADAVDFRDQLTADADAREAFNAYRRAHRETLLNAQDGFLTRTGANGLTIREPAEERLTALREEFGQGLSPRALRAYGERVDGLQDQAHQQLLTHEAGETRNYVVNQYGSTIDGYVEDAATNWANEELFQENLQLALDEQRRLAALQGWDSATLEQSATELRSSAYRARIVQTAINDPLRAQELLEASREVLSSEDEYALDTGLRQQVIEARGRALLQQFNVTGPRVTTGTGTGVVQAGAGYTVVRNADGSVVRREGTRAWRNNNPGNIEYGNFARSQGAIGTDGRFAVFRTYEEGRAAKATLIFESGSYRNLTIDQAIARYAPAFENDTNSYAAQVAAAAGVPRSTVMSSLSSQQRTAVLDAMERVEGFRVGSEQVVQQGSLSLPGGGRDITTFVGRLGYDGVDAMMESAGVPNNTTNRRMYEALGEGASSLIAAADLTPTLPANIALSPELMQANPAFEGMTVGEVYDTFAAAVGDSPQTREGGAYFDVQGAYQAALAIEDPEVQAYVMQQITARSALQDRVNAASRAQAQEEGWRIYTQTGEAPMHLRTAMGQSGWTSFQSAVQSDQRGALVTDPDTWELLTRMASSQPRQFAELNLAAHYGNLSGEDRQRFIATQEAVRAELRGAARDAETARNTIDFNRVYTAADEVYRAVVEQTAPTRMNEEQRLRRLQFQQQLTRMVQDFYDRETREPNVAEIRDMATTLAMPVEFFTPGGLFTGGFDGVNEQGTGALFDAAQRGSDVQYRIAVSYDDIPLADRTRIAQQIMASNGGTIPSEDEIANTYEQQRLMGAGLPPHVDIATVPEWLIEIERGANPAITDDELVELYQAYLLSR